MGSLIEECNFDACVFASLWRIDFVLIIYSYFLCILFNENWIVEMFDAWTLLCELDEIKVRRRYTMTLQKFRSLLSNSDKNTRRYCTAMTIIRKLSLRWNNNVAHMAGERSQCFIYDELLYQMVEWWLASSIRRGILLDIIQASTKTWTLQLYALNLKVLKKSFSQHEKNNLRLL